MPVIYEALGFLLIVVLVIGFFFILVSLCMNYK
jgi:hypothetical protein